MNNDEFLRSLNEVSSVFSDTLSKVGEIHERNISLAERISSLEATIEGVLASLNSSRYDFKTRKEMEDAMCSMKVGRATASLKGIDVFTLYVGDSYVIVIYPNFVDIGVPHSDMGDLRSSCWLLGSKSWDRKLNTDIKRSD